MARLGRPTKLHHLIAAPTTEDPTRVLPVCDFICEQMQANGRSAVAQADLAGLSRVTIQTWLKTGAAAEVRKSQNKLLYPHEVRFLDFLIATRLAHSQWAATSLATHHSIAAGGLSTVEVTEKVDPTRMVEGEDGRMRPTVLERRVKTTRMLPDAASIRWELEHLARDEFPRRVEVTGAEGGPIKTEDVTVEEQARRMMAELDKADVYARAVSDGREREAELVNDQED